MLNGKLDLVQAESIADLINARTRAAGEALARAICDGAARAGRAAAIRESLLHVISRLEAALDFSEEGYEFITRDEARARDRARDRGYARRWRRRIAADARRRRGLDAGDPRPPERRQVDAAQSPGRQRPRHRHADSGDDARHRARDDRDRRTAGDDRRHRRPARRAATSSKRSASRARARRRASADIILYLVDATAGSDGRRRAGDVSRSRSSFTRRPISLRRRKARSASASRPSAASTTCSSRLDALVRERSPPRRQPRQRATASSRRSAVRRRAARRARRIARCGLDEPVILVDLYRAAERARPRSPARSRRRTSSPRSSRSSASGSERARAAVPRET